MYSEVVLVVNRIRAVRGMQNKLAIGADTVSPLLELQCQCSKHSLCGLRELEKQKVHWERFSFYDRAIGSLANSRTRRNERWSRHC